MTIESLLIDVDTYEALESVYDYQVSGETVNWYYEEFQSFPGYFDVVAGTIRRVDKLIDLDFEYTSDYFEADLEFWVDDFYSPDNPDGNLGLFSDYGDWGLIEIFIGSEESIQSNINTAVHEFGHYLGLGEPGFDGRFDQLDSAMSYNPSEIVDGGFQTFFTHSDLTALLALHGVENDNGHGFEGTVSDNFIKGTNGKDIITGFAGNDELRGGQGGDHIFGGHGNDLISGGNGRDYLSGGSGEDDIIGGFGHNTFDNERDGSVDRIFFKSDQFAYNWLYGSTANNPSGKKVDIIKGLDKVDRLFVQGVETSDLTFSQVTNFAAPTGYFSGIGIYANGFLEGLYTGGDLTSSQLQSMTTGVDALDVV